MRIRLEYKGSAFELDRPPMPEKRFKAVCKLAGAAIGGAVLLGAIHMARAWTIAWAVGALVVYGFYMMIQQAMKD